MYFWTQWSSDITGTKGAVTYFGDVVPARSTDSYATIIGGGNYPGTSSNWGGGWATGATTNFPCCLTGISQPPNYSYILTGKFWARSYTGIGPGVVATTQHDASRIPEGYIGGNSYFSDTGTASWCKRQYRWDGAPAGYPSSIDNGLYLSPITASDGQYYRGLLPGIWASMSTDSNTNFHEYRMYGSGVYAGKQFLFLGSPWGQFAFEISDTW